MTSACPSCGKKYTMPADAVGRDFVCRKCGSTVLIQSDGLKLVEPAAPPRRPKPERPIRVEDDDSDDGIPVRRRPEPTSPVADYLLFRKPMSIGAIVRGYWIATLLCVAGGGFTIYSSFDVPSVSLGGADLGSLMGGGDALGGGGLQMPSVKRGFSLPLFLVGVAQVVVVPLLLRAGCEFVITFLRIYNRLGEIKDALEQNATRPPSAAG